ncbi:hypothetical protein [Pantoea vagans]|uniref:hypothetical protein n=1 Tax=Pantoea vagans TaxID=470934 RepID=UPI0023AF4403|nr:hypothetical protein [Pantoea vagans]MDE8557322.1 hypothetical protein [Pantoea vagans]MDE8577736.1 hypothetical protein [Pantoea vagans]
MSDYLLEEVKLQRIDFILKKVAFGTCDFEEKEMAIHWLVELSSELMAEVRKAKTYNTEFERH